MALAFLLMLNLIGTPFRLKTDLMTDTRTVYSNGYATSASLTQVQEAWKRGQLHTYQVATVHTPKPRLGWQLPDGLAQQQSYRVLMATQPQLLQEGKADVWDSGWTTSSQSNGIACGAQDLQPATVYYWTVRVTDPQGNASPYAKAQAFLTAPQWDNEMPRLPLRKTPQHPTRLTEAAPHIWVADFGKAAFAQLQVTVEATECDTLLIRLGEASKDGKVDTQPGASIRYCHYTLPVQPGLHTYRLAFRPDGRNAVIKPHGTDVRPVLMPEYIGEVYPFRYCQVESRNATLKGIRREMVHYAWDDKASYFHSSDTILNQVWELSRYSILATSFAGVYVDGDRERIPYEADALINQLCHYCVDQEYTLARYSADYLFRNATGPTEWILQAVLMAWYDYLYTADPTLLQRNYEVLKARTLMELKEENGLISTRTGKQTPQLLKRCGYYGKEIRDIVDWPQSGALGIGKEEPGEADGYDLRDFNTVVNAYHYQATLLMAQMAEALGNATDAAYFRHEAEKTCKAVNQLLYDKERGAYVDGIGSTHHALHASLFPMAFGMVPAAEQQRVLQHIQSRGMACSVYGSHFLLEALYRGNMDEYALQLLTATGERSWYNMIRTGSTITLEAWDRKFKPNLDWNHAWGAAPANAIPRLLMGIEPTGPGWKRMRIQPRPGTLKEAQIKVPTLLGSVEAAFVQTPDSFALTVGIPSGTVAEVALPCPDGRIRLTVDGQKQKGTRKGKYICFELQPGRHTCCVEKRR